MYSIEEYRIVDSVQEAMGLLDANRRNTILAGGLWLRMTHKRIKTAIDMSRCGLDQIKTDSDWIDIGAMVTLRQLETNEILHQDFDCVLSASVKHIVGTQFRNMATVGASVYSRYGFSDIVTALLALDAEVELFRAGRMPLSAFIAEPPKRDILTHIYLKRDGKKASYQTIRRTKTDFGIVDLCVSVDDENRYIVSVGARPMVAMRCDAAEASLKKGDIEAAAKAVSEIPFGTNMRASASYRSAMVSVLLKRAYAALKEGEA